MTIERTYRCNLCGESKDKSKLFGLWYNNHDVPEERQPTETERHICFRCLAGVRAIPARCGKGFRGCNGGPLCSYEHK